jgi:hypothetical protein
MDKVPGTAGGTQRAGGAGRITISIDLVEPIVKAAAARCRTASRPFAHRWVRQDGVTQRLIRQVCEHRCLYGGQHSIGVSANHRAAENTIVSTNERFHEASSFVSRVPGGQR